jgi:hypothetical protein
MSLGWALRSVALALMIIASNFGGAQGQQLSCPYRAGLPTAAACLNNLSPAPIPQGMGGAAISPTQCGNAIGTAIASMHVYDDAACYSGRGSLLGASPTLTIVEEMEKDLGGSRFSRDFILRLYRRRRLSHPLSPPVSHPLSHTSS